MRAPRGQDVADGGQALVQAAAVGDPTRGGQRHVEVDPQEHASTVEIELGKCAGGHRGAPFYTQAAQGARRPGREFWRRVVGNLRV